MRNIIPLVRKKLEAIPASKWCSGEFLNKNGQCCVLGHLGMRDYLMLEHCPEAKALYDLVKIERKNYYKLDIIEINNTPTDVFPQKTPKGRVMAALNYMEKLLKKKKK